MRKLLCLLLCVISLVSLCACTKQQDDLIDPISFYYLQVQLPNQIQHGTVHSVIAPERREGQGLRQDMTALLEQYLAGPNSDTCVSPFPANTTLVKLDTDGTTLCVTLSDEAAALTGIDLTLACACMAKTCLELGEYGAVRFQAESLSLDGKVSITMNQRILLLLDDTMTETQPTEA